MNATMITLAVIISVSSAVFINPSEGASKQNHPSDVSKGWQYFKLYQPHNSEINFNTDTHVYPKYEFEYAVSDKSTGDHKHHHEISDGDRVRGEYSLIEPDGSLRNVRYTADNYNGFNAIVSSDIQNHGDQAISTIGHTRHFPRFGHGFKINHFFPNKTYTPHRGISSNENLESKPVKETMEVSFLNKNDSEISRETESMNIAAKHEEHQTILTTDNEKPITKTKTKEGQLVKIMAAETTTTDYVTTENSTDNNNTLQMSNNNDEVNEGYGKNATIVEIKHLQNTNHSRDSETGSSYFSRIYYVGF